MGYQNPLWYSTPVSHHFWPKAILRPHQPGRCVPNRYINMILNKLSQSKCPISVPTHQRQSSPDLPYLIDIQIFKIPESPGLFLWLTSLLPGISTPWTPHYKAEGLHLVQGETGPYIPTYFWVFPVPFFLQVRIQLLSWNICILSHHPVHL